MLPFDLEKQMEKGTLLYTFKDMLELMAWASLPEDTREGYTIEYFKETYPDVFDKKIIEANRILQCA